jgi:hypothetical protein
MALDRRGRRTSAPRSVMRAVPLPHLRSVAPRLLIAMIDDGRDPDQQRSEGAYRHHAVPTSLPTQPAEHYPMEPFAERRAVPKSSRRMRLRTRFATIAGSRRIARATLTSAPSGAVAAFCFAMSQ